MKKVLIFFVAILCNTFYAQTDTAQVMVPNRYNSVSAQEKPYVIMISADGFRHDYMQKYSAENLQQFAENGVKAQALIPSFPSITFPNHWSLITGLYPAHHGVIDNYFYDYKWQTAYKMNDKQIVEDGSWYSGTPLWALAEQQGVLSASMMWVGSASDAGDTRPTYYYHYHEQFSPQEKVSKVVNWLKLPENQRPHFITLYFPEVDGAGHRFGPESLETERAVHSIDAAIGDLVQRVNELGLKNVNYIFVADHGMIAVEVEKPIEIPQILFDKNRFDFYNSQTLLRVVVKDQAETKAAYRQLKKNKTADYKVYLTKRFPRKLHFATRDDRQGRIGQIILLPRAPKIFLEKGRKTTVGKHGYNPYRVPEMKATFVAFGPAFKQIKSIREFENVHVFPIVADILELKIKDPIDGNHRISDQILIK